MRRWTPAVLAVLIGAGGIATIKLSEAAPHPPEPPRRASDVRCVRHADPDLAVKGDRARIARDRHGCIRWRPPTPMVRGHA